MAPGDARKLLVVLRAKAGDAVEVVDSAGRRFAAVLLGAAEPLHARLESVLAEPSAPAVALTLAQAIPKGQKMDFIVEKATELGVVRIVPLVTRRTLGDGERAGKLERWRRIARTAAQQCGRSDVPPVAEPLGWEAFVGAFGAAERVLVPWELGERVPLRERLPELLAGASAVTVAIGPEGGFESAEIDAAVAAGAHALSLGERILRTETAGLVACAAILYAAGTL